MSGKKSVERETSARFREQGKERNVIVILDDSGLVGFRLKGLQRVEFLPADACYSMAVKARVRDEQKRK